jgi:hypothetical protein
VLSSAEADGRERFKKQYLTFDRGIFQVDYPAGKVTQVYAPPAGERLRQLTPIDKERLAIVLDNVVEIHRASSEVVGEWGDFSSKSQHEVRVEVPGELVSTIPLPNEIRPFETVALGELPGRDEVVFRCRNTITDMVRFVTIKKHGEVLAVRDFPSLPPRGLNQRATVFLWLCSSPSHRCC